MLLYIPNPYSSSMLSMIQFHASLCPILSYAPNSYCCSILLYITNLCRFSMLSNGPIDALCSTMIPLLCALQYSSLLRCSTFMFAILTPQNIHYQRTHESNKEKTQTLLFISMGTLPIQQDKQQWQSSGTLLREPSCICMYLLHIPRLLSLLLIICFNHHLSLLIDLIWSYIWRFKNVTAS